jgi:hypothetical protein
VAKLIVQHDVDPGIAVILAEVLPGTPGQAQGWHGQCTECGKTFHRWHKERAEESARGHVDSHESSL